ncbi:nodulation protein NodZ [Haloferula chungangensis]|uniref:Nodulation protein NodZ n=1 Tax=Haloferula chungangensis TaxID=1048331 RepID=A0ABW2LDI9_9BACT
MKDKYLVVKGKAGMGNRLLYLAYSVVYAIASQRALHIDWRDEVYSDDGVDAFEALFALKGIEINKFALQSIGDLEVYPEVWSGNLDMSVGELSSCLKEVLDCRWRVRENIMRGSEDFDVMTSVPVRVKWGYNSHINNLPTPVKMELFGTTCPKVILRWFFGEVLVPCEEVRNRVDTFSERYGELIGVHVRHSDKKSGQPVEQCFERIDELNSLNQIFLATDNVEVLEEFERRYGGRIVTTSKWYPEAGRSAHKNETCPDRLENAREALVDIYLLAKCETFLRQAGSTFGDICDHIAGRDSPAWNK